MPGHDLPLWQWPFEDVPAFERGDATREAWAENAARRLRVERRAASIAAQEQIRVGVGPVLADALAQVRDPRDRATLTADHLLCHQEPRTGAAHARWERECAALARSLLAHGQLGLGTTHTMKVS